MSTVSPKGYQEDAVNKTLEIFRHAESQLQQVNDDESRHTISAFNGCMLLEAPTGAGKTLMAGLIAETFSGCEHHYNAKVIWFWFTPFANLVGQAKSALKHFSGLKIRDLSSDRIAHKANSGDVFVTTWASVAANNANTRIFRKNGDASVSLDEFIVELREQGFRIGVVIDEAHHTFTKASEAVKFYRDILSPEFSLLITATPNDTDVDKFKKAAGIAEIHKTQVSREDAVNVGLIKEAVKSIAYLLPEVPDNQQALIDLDLTALADGWRTHEAIKSELAQLKINLTPLMLVQIDSKGKAGEKAVEDTKQRLIGLGVPEDSIAWYTADDPNDELSVVARNESKQVLIFKVAAALGFDAPRAFTLVSLRSTKSTDFGIQVVGRILRVHHKLQTRAANKLLPEILRFGYVFLADIEAQGGLIGAADKINTLKTQLSDITPFTLLVTIAGQTEVQVSHNGQTSLLPSPYIPPDWEEKPVIENDDNTVLLPSLSGETVDLWGDFIAPKTGKVEDLKQPNYRPLIAGNQYYQLRDIMPVRFQSERIPLGTDDLVKGIVARINLNAEVLNAGRRKSIKVNRLTINIFNQTGTVVEAIQAKLSSSEIIRRSQNALCDGVIDPKDLQSALLAQLAKEYNEYQGMELSTIELAQSLNMILALYPALIRNASKSCLAQVKEMYDTAELPKQIEASESINRASLNSYGVMPTGLNETERKFAQLLETDTSNTVRWWHRNEDRKPHSVSIVLPNGHRYFPDFIIGVNNRTRGEGILLVEIKGGHILNSPDTLEKITAEHKVYGNPIMLTLDNGKFSMMEYIESTNKIEKKQPFRVENMGQY